MSARPPVASRRGRVLDAAILLALAAWSVVSLLVVESASPDGPVFAGVDGIVAIDQLQYLAWIREAADSVVVSNRFEIGGGGEAVFLHPLFALSGVLFDAGLSIQLSLLIWKPVAVVALFLGFRAYVRRFFDAGAGLARPAVALVLSLFLYYPIQSLLENASLGTPDERFRAGILTLELFPAGLLWGYLPSAIAVGLMPLFLLALERLVDPARRAPGRGARWYAGWAAAAGLLASWLHPWRGMVLLGIAAGLVLLDPDRRRYRAAALPLLATAAPLAYYALLSRVDAAWEHATEQNAILKPPLWALLLTLAPLAAIAALGARGRPADVQHRILVLWPLVSFAAYFAAPSFPSHAFAGASLPIAILAVRAWDRLPLPTIAAAAAVAVAVVPGMVSSADLLQDSVEAKVTPHYLTPSEKRALDYLAGAAPGGGVLPTPYLGMAVPGFADRDSWLGNYLWTPDYYDRRRRAEALFGGRLHEEAAVAVVRSSGARFVLSDCRVRRDVAADLRPAVAAVRRFGCATVVELRGP